jgi:hypothetical protein
LIKPLKERDVCFESGRNLYMSIETISTRGHL